MISIETQSAKATQQVARLLSQELRPSRTKATVLALIGKLGAGKTTFTQGLARSFGIKDRVLSPTFVLMKIYPLARGRFRHLIHIDCYRLDSPADLTHLGFRDLLKDKDAVILVEWADRIRRLLPRDTLWIELRHGQKPNERKIYFKPK